MVAVIDDVDVDGADRQGGAGVGVGGGPVDDGVGVPAALHVHQEGQVRRAYTVVIGEQRRMPVRATPAPPQRPGGRLNCLCGIIDV